MHIFTLSILISLFAFHASAEKASLIEQLSPLAFLVGEWEGHGWKEFRPGHREHFTSYEKVQAKLGGEILVIDGVHKDKNGETVHNAFGIISFNQRTGEHEFKAYVEGRGSGQHKAQVIGNSLHWRLEMPNFEMRYTTSLNDKGQWSEVGEISHDGVTWRKMFEMTLSRVN